ncbi:MOSC domain-containing protein [Actinomyces slackii]|uniref:6-N-hydroxylaminopurine resistance protein n=2 Tax=Actinomyces slackii TaxID=52774 RepID=A0A448KDJ6_9ACTO|nr:MOSC domain-containing protein [Actinomyces slackii]VEG74991.1 6-N-hydroxylaminopurine resistance protein [Actinomyces slackii]
MSERMIDGVPVTSGTVEAAMSDDGSGLVLSRPLARVLGEPHAGADGRHDDEPSPFAPGEAVGRISAVCAVRRLRPDCGDAGVSAIRKGPIEGPAEVNALGIVNDQQADRAHHGGTDKALYVMDGAEARHWSGVLGGIEPGALGENMLIESAAGVGIDDVEIGAVLSIGDPGDGGITVRVTGVRNPCPTFARGVGRADWVEVFSSRNRVGVYLAVLGGGRARAGDEVGVVTTPGHGVTCRRWFAHHDPRDARAMLDAEASGRCVIAPFTRKYVQAAAGERPAAEEG